MNIKQLSFEIIEQEPGINGVYKAAEVPGRVCYHSLDKMTSESAMPFVKRLMEANHGAPLEHATIYLKMAWETTNFDEKVSPIKYMNNPYSHVNFKQDPNNVNKKTAYVTTNLRVLFENNWMGDLQYMCDEPTEFHEKRVSVRFICNIGLSREFNRHRVNSINEESTRYCNYSKDKFGNEINIIANNNKFGDRLEQLKSASEELSLFDYCNMIVNNGTDDCCDFSDIDYWLFANKAAEFSYLGLTQKCGWQAQDARDVLPLDIQSTLIHTAFVKDWKHFFDLRADGKTGAPHPQAKELATKLKDEFVKRNLI